MDVPKQASQRIAWGVSSRGMDQDEQLICSTKWLVASSAWRAKTAWEAAAQARAVAEKCEHRVRETQLLLNQTDTLLRELEHHLPGFWLQSPPPRVKDQ